MALVSNPILSGCYPDPSICRVGDDYYLVTSTFEYFPGLPVFHSTDLATWTQIGSVIDREGQLDYTGIPSSGGLYAPTIRYHDGLFWVVCTQVYPDEPDRAGNFVVTATDPAGPWSDPIWLGTAGIDPSIFFDDDGRVWFHGTRLALEPQWHHQTEVWVREYDLTTNRLIGPETVIWKGAQLGVVWAEGPHLYKIDGRYYLMAAEGGTEIHHCECIARADAVTGPYEGNRANPVLTHRHLGHHADVVGVGHADLVQAADNSWWAVTLAMRPYGGYHYPLGRETFLVPVTWEDGWPVFAAGLGRVPAAVEVPFAAAVVPQTGENLGPDDLRWTTLRGPASFAAPHGDGWRLHPTADDLSTPGRPAFLGVRQTDRAADFAFTLHGRIADGEEAGLVVRQSEQDHLRLAVQPGEGGVMASLVHRQAGVETVLGTALLATEASALRLSVRIRAATYAFSIAAGDDPAVLVGTADGTTLDTVSTGGFLGLWLGVYATAHGRDSATVLDVDEVVYRPVPRA